MDAIDKICLWTKWKIIDPELFFFVPLVALSEGQGH